MNLPTTRRVLAGLLTAGLAGTTTLLPGAAGAAEPPPDANLTRQLGEENPYMAPGGVGAMHGDSYSSDAQPQRGPGTGPISAELAADGRGCPTVLLDRTGNVVAHCVDRATGQGQLSVIDPATLAPLATMPLPSAGGPGGLSVYLDEQDRAVLGDGAGHVLRIAHARTADGDWFLRVTDDWDVSGPVTAHCGGVPGCDRIESVVPDFRGLIWFSSAGGVVGTVAPSSGAARAVNLPEGEGVSNAISASPAGVAVASDHALYLMRAGDDGTPRTTSRLPYDRGTSVKPGRLSQGTGTTPVFFGRGGSRFVAITDNSDSRENLLIHAVDRRTGEARLLCSTPLFAPGASAAENAPIGLGNSVAVANTYGYDRRPGRPVVALPGGLTRVDVRADESGCDQVWTNPVPSVGVPKLSTVDGDVYTVQRTPDGGTEEFALAVVDFATGRTAAVRPLGTGPRWDAGGLAGVANRAGVLYQGTAAGLARIGPGR